MRVKPKVKYELLHRGSDLCDTKHPRYEQHKAIPKTQLISSKPRSYRAKRALLRLSTKSSWLFIMVLVGTYRQTPVRKIGGKELSKQSATNWSRNCLDCAVFRLQAYARWESSMKNGVCWSVIRSLQRTNWTFFLTKRSLQRTNLQKLTLSHQS